MRKMLIALAALALAANVANARDRAVFELHVEYEGGDYVADANLTGDDCLDAIDHIKQVEISPGVFADVAPDAPVYCVSM